MSRNVSNSEDILDSRDIEARRQELQDECDELAAAVEEAEQAAEASAGDALDTARDALLDWAAGNGVELKTLTALCDEGSGYSGDWQHGATLIRDTHFEDYARELAEDIGALDRDLRWPHSCIDWEQAAEELQQDYTALDYDGVTYWVR